MNLYEQYASEIYTEEQIIELMSKPDYIKEFKKFLIKNYISYKVFNMLPNIMKKKGDNYLDEELELNQLNQLDLEVEPEEDDGRMFTKRDFMDDNAGGDSHDEANEDDEDFKHKQQYSY